MNKNRMTVEELRELKPSLSNPIELVCDDDYFTDIMKTIKVIGLHDGGFNLIDTMGRAASERDYYLKHYPSLEPELLTFDRIKTECEPMKHLLVDGVGDKRLYLGFNRCGELVTDCSSKESSFCWSEYIINDWSIENYNE